MHRKNVIQQSEKDLNEKIDKVKDIIATLDECQNTLTSLNKLIEETKDPKNIKSKENAKDTFWHSLKQLVIFIFSGGLGAALGLAILSEFVFFVLTKIDFLNNSLNNFLTSSSNSDMMRHLKLVISVLPIILLVFIAFLYLYKLFEFGREESQQIINKNQIIFINLCFILIFLVVAMYYPWSVVEPIITIATAIVLPYVFWLDKRYK